MKKLVLTLALAVFTTMAFAQKKVARSAERNFKKGNLEEALTDVEEALQHPDTKDEPAVLLTKAKTQTKMFEMEEDITASTVSLGKDAFANFQKVMEMEGGDKTSKIGKEVHKDDSPELPENLRPWNLNTLKFSAFNKAIMAYEEDDFEMSYEMFALVSEIDPTDTTSNFNAGFLANDLGKTEEAKMHFNRLLDIEDYDKLNTYYFLVQIASGEDQDPEAAYNYVVRGREDYPEDKTLAEFEIQLLLQMEKMDEALESVQKALASDPENPGLLLRYGYLLEQSGDLDGAFAQYQKSVEADEEFFEGNFYAGAILLERARKIIAEINNLSDDEWEEKAPEMGEEADGLYAKAVPYFTRATEIREGEASAEALELLFQIHSRLKNTEEAEKYNQKLISIYGPDWMDR
ncbi:MAG: methyltransferase [Mongoliibacter sp.]|uniref:tetratricopeptide repeat protein n=1 Tax=Mongoliibacter sp. TaxID=2022438 RepID=UPI0012F0000E|nr:tetratricopeptide repeat protein [Mongoliibacter sp.]TVP49311.1 MAG: methyltransferase [Mongoliibacter sp.]